jgi:ligand-binding sensor domain-containing protein/AraC-like DNA-binding protein
VKLQKIVIGIAKTKLTLLLILSICFFFKTSFVNASDILHFSKISLEQGSPGAKVKCSFLDSYGYMWFGLDAKGLCRFDGTNFRLFSASDDTTSLSSNFVTSISEDKYGNLWVGTEFGLSRYNRSTNTFQRWYVNEDAAQTLADNKINIIHNDSRGVLWVGTDRGLSKLTISQGKEPHFEQLRLTDVDHRLKHRKDICVNAFFEDPFHQYWIGTKYGLFKYDSTLTILNFWPNQNLETTGLPCQRIYDIQRIDSSIYLGSNKGVMELHENKGVFSFRLLSLTPKFSNVNAIVEYDEKIWVATEDDGLFIGTKRQLKDGESFEKASQIVSSQIEDLYISKQGLLFISTQPDGLYYTHRDPRIQYYMEGFPCSAYFKDYLGNEWMGTTNEGLYWKGVKEENFKRVIPEETSEAINCIAGNTKRVYLGTNGGLIECDIQSKQFKTIDFHKVQSILDLGDSLIVGTKKGIYVFHPRFSRFSPLINGQDTIMLRLGTIITSLARDGATIWIGTDSKGVYSYHLSTKKLQHFFSQQKTKAGLSSNYIRCIWTGAKGRVWIGTKYGGINCYYPKSNKMQSFKGIVELSKNAVYAIFEDKKGAVWMGTHDGYALLYPETNTLVNLNSSVGLKPNSFVFANAAFPGHGDQVLFGTTNGLIGLEIDTAKSFLNGSFVISSFKANNREVLNYIIRDTAITLEHDQNYIEIELAFLDFITYKKQQLCYQLEAKGNQWHAVGNDNMVLFSELQPGSYKFRFGLRNVNGKIQEAPFLLSLRVKPPLWHSTFAYVIYFLCSLILVYSCYQYIDAKTKMKSIASKTSDLQLQEALQDALLQLSKWINLLEVKTQLSNATWEKAKLGLEKISSLVSINPLLDLDPDNLNTASTEVSDDLFLKQCYEILDNHYRDPHFSVTQCCQLLGLSRTNLYSKVKKITGFTPSNLIWEYRLLKASSMMKDKTFTISEIAHNCGFENISSFSTMYKKRFGKSPSQSRQDLSE